MCKEVGGIDGAGSSLGRGNKGCVSYVGGGPVKCEIIFVSCKPVGLHVYGVSNERVGVGCELDFYVSELGARASWRRCGRR